MNAIDLMNLFRRELELCKVKPGEVMAVLTGAGVATRLCAGVRRRRAAARCRGVPPRPARAAAGVEILKRADVLIDLVGLLHSPEQVDIQKAGTRVLMVLEPPEILARMLPRPESRARVEAGARRLARAKTLRITSPAGTDLTYQLGQYSTQPIQQYGYTDEPGRWDHFPGTFVYTWPNEGMSGGTIVLSPGDIIFPFKEFVRSEIRIDVRDGWIRSIEGGFDAKHLDHFLASWNDADAYAMAHIGWGLGDMALWNSISLFNKESIIGQDGRSFYGNILCSTGPNTDVGGSRNTPAHLDIAMTGASLYLDDEPIVVDGDVIPRGYAFGAHEAALRRCRRL